MYTKWKKEYKGKFLERRDVFFKVGLRIENKC